MRFMSGRGLCGMGWSLRRVSEGREDTISNNAKAAMVAMVCNLL